MTDLRQFRARRMPGTMPPVPDHSIAASGVDWATRASTIVLTRNSAGETTTLWAEQFDVAKSTILGMLRANNVVVQRQPVTHEQVAQAARCCQ